jgi:hypothetical protein
MAGIEDMRVVLEGEIGPFEKALQQADSALGTFEKSAGDKLGKVDKAMGALGSGGGAAKGLAALHPKVLLAQVGVEGLAKGLAFLAGSVDGDGGLSKAATQVETLKTELQAANGPMEMLTAAFTFASGMVETFGESVSVSEDGVVKLKHATEAAGAVLGEEWAKVRAAAVAALDVVVARIAEAKAAMASLPEALAYAGQALQSAFAALQAMFDAFWRSMAATMHVHALDLVEGLIGLVNRALAQIAALINGTIDLINRIPGIKIDVEVGAPRIPNPLEGAAERAREEYRKAGVTLGQDLVKGAVDYVAGETGLVKRIMEKARELAEKTEEDEDDEEGAATKKASDKARRAAEQVAEVYRRALQAQGDYLSAVEIGHAKELARFVAMKKEGLLTEEQFQRARESLEMVRGERIIQARERMHQREMQLTRRTEALEALKRYTEVVIMEYEREAAKQDEMLEHKRWSEARYQEARANLAIVAAKKLAEAAEREFAQVREMTNAVASSMERAFTNFMETGKLDFREFARSVMADIARIAFRAAILNTLFGQSGQGFGALGSLLGLPAGIPGRAAGGPVTAGRPYMVGERGPELFIPRVSGSIAPNHALAGSGGGGVNVSMPITIDARGAYPESIQDIRREVDRLEASLPRRIVTTVADARARRVLR